jgi:hypothetical protein
MEIWEEPTWDEIRMSAEIGGYQPDGDDREGDPTAIPEPEPARAEREE